MFNTYRLNCLDQKVPPHYPDKFLTQLVILILNRVFFYSTSYTTAAYGSHQNVLLRLDTLGRPPSSTGSYATIASLHKFPFGKFLTLSFGHRVHIQGYKIKFIQPPANQFVAKFVAQSPSLNLYKILQHFA